MLFLACSVAFFISAYIHAAELIGTEPDICVTIEDRSNRLVECHALASRDLVAIYGVRKDEIDIAVASCRKRVDIQLAAVHLDVLRRNTTFVGITEDLDHRVRKGIRIIIINNCHFQVVQLVLIIRKLLLYERLCRESLRRVFRHSLRLVEILITASMQAYVLDRRVIALVENLIWVADVIVRMHLRNRIARAFDRDIRIDILDRIIRIDIGKRDILQIHAVCFFDMMLRHMDLHSRLSLLKMIYLLLSAWMPVVM